MTTEVADEQADISTDVALSVAVAVAKCKSNLDDYVGPEDLSGGQKITSPVAIELKNICWGSATTAPRPIWLRSGIILHKPEDIFAYGIKAPNNGTKSFLMCIQAYFLKHLFFEEKKKGGEVRRQSKFSRKGQNRQEDMKRIGSVKTNQILRPKASVQEDMIVGGLAEILFKAAEGGEVVVCMIGPENCFDSNANYGIDGFTEKMHLFRKKKIEDVKATIKRFYPQIVRENGIGVLTFLYSLILSRTFKRMKADLQNEVENSLVDMRGDATTPLLHLVLFGRATPYLHNGSMEVKDENGEPHMRDGITERCEIGFLLWDTDEAKTASYNIGSRLKTPTLPLWATRCNDTIGILFNPNKELLKTYDAEKRFSLYYYCNHEFKDEEKHAETKLTIETLVKKAAAMKEFDPEDEKEEPPLEALIRTKWEGATIHWNGMEPYY